MAIAVSPSFLPVAAPLKEVPRHVAQIFHLFLLGTALVSGACLQAVGPAWSRAIFDQVKPGSVLGFSALLLALLISILAHELGHLSAALFLNFEILGFAVGPFRCERQHGKVIFRYLQRNWSNCSISAVARDLRNCWRFRTMSVIAAGPAFTFLLLIVSLRLAIPLNGPIASNGWPAQFWSACAEVNFFILLLGLIPNGRWTRVRNDAALFLALKRNSGDALDMFRCHQAIDLALGGTRPQDYPQSLLLELSGFCGRPYTNLMAARRIVEWAADSDDLATAASWDQYALAAGEKCGGDEANRALAESACFDVLFRGDLRSARHRFAQVDFDSLFPPAFAERAKAARLIACDLPQRAGKHILQGQYELPAGIPFYEYERMLLAKLHDLALAGCQSRYLTAAGGGA
jgi:hypothetical protein